LYLLIYDGTFELARAINFTTTWQRFTFTLHINATTSDFVLGFSDAGGWVGLGGPASVYLWQGDLAQNAYARSPVLTTTASATQAADVAHMASTSLPVAAGVVRLNFTPLWSTPPAAGAALIDSRGASATATKGVTVYVDSASKLNFGIGTTTALAQSAALTWTAGTIYTIQAVWGSGTVTLYRNGTQVGQSTSVTMPGSHDQLNLLDGRLGDGTFAADGNLSGLCFDTKTPACAGGP
jgi:hypothetical protein